MKLFLTTALVGETHKGYISRHNIKYINDRVEMPITIDIKQLPAAYDITATSWHDTQHLTAHRILPIVAQLINIYQLGVSSFFTEHAISCPSRIQGPHCGISK